MIFFCGEPWLIVHSEERAVHNGEYVVIENVFSIRWIALP